MPDDEIAELRAKSEELGERLGDEEALEVNAAILDLDPGDPVATNRLGIGLLKAGQVDEAIVVLEAGLRIHPDNPIMVRRLEEARKTRDRPAQTGSRRRRGPGSAGGSVGWTDFDPAELVERCLAGLGRDACIRMCAASILESENIDRQWTAVTPIKDGRRFRTIGGIFTGVGPWKDALTVAVPTAHRALIGRIRDLGGYTFEPAKAVPCVQVVVPRPLMDDLVDDLMPAHVEHLRLSLAAGPPTHLNKHHPGLRQYLLDQAARLKSA